MVKNFRGMALLIVVLSSTLVSACSGTSSLRIGWSCFDGLQKIDCSYREFSGYETRYESLAAGDTLQFQYDVIVEAGTLTFTIEDPRGEIIHTMTLTESERDNFYFTAEEGGRYRIQVEGVQTEGKFTIGWGREA